MPRPVCVKCEVEYRPEKNDIVVEEIVSFGSYKLWCADLWKCPGCEHLLITGYGNQAFAEHYQNNYKEILFKTKTFKIYEKPRDEISHE
jgi:hypothetical protein